MPDSAPNPRSFNTLDLSFPHRWEVKILAARPLIRPKYHYVYPREVEEVERGALEILVQSEASTLPKESDLKFLATCALGFRDPSVPTGVWSCPNPEELCAVAGGYAYIIDTNTPERFTMLPYRPVFAVRAAVALGLLLFIGNRNILAWGSQGQAWESDKLSDEGLTITALEDGILRGVGWHMMTDKEVAFELNLRDGQVLRT